MEKIAATQWTLRIIFSVRLKAVSSLAFQYFWQRSTTDICTSFLITVSNKWPIPNFPFSKTPDFVLFCGTEKWTMSEDELQNNCLIATYPFTSPIVDVRITDYVIHALTDHGIETYTHRIGHKLFSCAYEYNLRDDLFTIEVCTLVALFCVSHA